MKRFTAEMKVGLITIVAALVAVYFFTELGVFSKEKEQMYTVRVLFRDVSGLTEGSDVRLSGIKIGSVTDIELYHKKAVVTLSVHDGVEIHRKDKVMLATLGIMGDKYVGIMPGDPEAPLVLNEEVPLEGSDSVGIDSLGASFDTLLHSLNGVADDVKHVSTSLKQALGNQQAADDLKAIVQNIKHLTENLSTLSAGKDADVSLLLQNLRIVSQDLRNSLPSILDKIDGMAGSANDLLTGENDDLRMIVDNIRSITEKLDRTVENMEKITLNIRDGKGSIGKLVNDEKTVESLNGALDSIKQTAEDLGEVVGTAAKIRTYIGYNVEYNGEAQGYRNAFSFHIVPSPDIYYHLELVDEPWEFTEYSTRLLGIQDASGYNEYRYTEQRSQDKLRYTLLYGRRLTDYLFIKGGLIESHGGLGADVLLFENRFNVSVEAWDLANEEWDPHVRLQLKYALGKNLFIKAAYDDIMNKERAAVVFGAGLRFEDNFLKSILGLIPIGSLAN